MADTSAAVGSSSPTETTTSPTTSNTIPNYRPVSQMSPEEIAAEARKILLASSSPKGSRHNVNSNGFGGNDDSLTSGNGNLRSTSGNTSARSALKRSGDTYVTDNNTDGSRPYSTYNNYTSSADREDDNDAHNDENDEEEGYNSNYRSDHGGDETYRSNASNNSSRRRVVITEEKQYAEEQVEMVDLPLSLALLYQAAYAVQLKQPCENLKKLLLDIAVVNGTFRTAEEMEAERLRRDACFRLFTQSTSQKEKMAEMRERMKTQLLQEEDKECTFKPTISKHGQEVRRNYHTPSGKVDFTVMNQHSNEWLKSRAKKLKVKAEKAETERLEAIKESIIPMSNRSKVLAERYRKKQEEKKAIEAALNGVMNNTTTTTSMGRNASPTNNSASTKRGGSGAAASPLSTTDAAMMASPIPNSKAKSRSNASGTTAEGGDNNGEENDHHHHHDEENGEGEQHPTDVSMAATTMGDGPYVDGEYYGNGDEDHEQDEDGDGAASPSAFRNDQHNNTSLIHQLSRFVDANGNIDKALLEKIQRFRRGALDDRSNASYYPSFEPVTKSSSSYDHYFKNNGGNGPSHGTTTPSRRARSGTAGGGELNRSNSGVDSPTPGGEDGQTTANARIVQRLLDDVEQRKLRQEERMKEAEERRKEKLFDPLTGQPFFKPNSIPTVVIGKKRVPVSELPAKEQEEAKKILKAKKLDFLLSVAKRKENDGSPQRDLDAFLKYCDEMQTQANRKVEKIRRLEEKELEGLFVPNINKRSEKMVDAKGIEKIHKRELPKKEAPPPPPPKKESDPEAIRMMMERSKQWEDRLAMRKNKKLNELAREEVQECTFKPQIRARVSKEMTAAAEQRLAGELAMLRRQQEEMARMEAEAAAMRGNSVRMASQSMRSAADRSSVRSAQSNNSAMYNEGGQQPASTGSYRRERPGDNHNPNNFRHTTTSNAPSPNNNAYNDGPSSHNNNNAPSEYRASSAAPAAASSPYGNNNNMNAAGNSGSFVGSESYPSPPQRQQQQQYPAAPHPAATTMPPQQHQDPNVDDLIDSWKELDALTDSILQSS